MNVRLQPIEGNGRGPLRRASAALDFAPVRLPADTRPTLFVVVDTEEEFDWSAPFSRRNVSVRALRGIHRAHRILARYGVKPTYVIDFPIASQADGYCPLRELWQSGECTIGAHLHPWVNPPFIEEVNERNSFACNLGASLEAAKLRCLKDEIGDQFGLDAQIYKAGRYGFGPSTIGVLERLGFEIDASVNPYVDVPEPWGPSFAGFNAEPFLFGRSRRLLEVPCTAGYVGIAGGAAPTLHRLASTALLRPARLVGALARLGIANKLMLSPEGFTGAELQSLTTALMADGVRTFALTFHSPSVEAGHTPYVRTQSDQATFLSAIDSYCDFFFGRLGGVTCTPSDFKRRLTSAPAGRECAAAEGT